MIPSLPQWIGLLGNLKQECHSECPIFRKSMVSSRFSPTNPTNPSIDCLLIPPSNRSNLAEHVLDLRQGGAWVQDHTGHAAHRLDLVQRTVQVDGRSSLVEAGATYCEMRYWMRIVSFTVFHGISRSKMEGDVENEDDLMIKDQEWWQMMKWWWNDGNLAIRLDVYTYWLWGTPNPWDLQSLGMAAVQNLSNTPSGVVSFHQGSLPVLRVWISMGLCTKPMAMIAMPTSKALSNPIKSQSSHTNRLKGERFYDFSARNLAMPLLSIRVLEIQALQFCQLSSNWVYFSGLPISLYWITSNL